MYSKNLLKIKDEIKRLSDQRKGQKLATAEQQRLKTERDWDEYPYYSSMSRRKIRHMLLAYGFLRGVPYKDIEKKSDSKPQSLLILEYLKSFGFEVPKEEVLEYLSK